MMMKSEWPRAQPVAGPSADLGALTPRGVRTLIEQLQLHQQELEQQNEELRRVRLALEESQAQYKALFERAPVSYVTLTTDGRIVQVNAAARAMLQHDAERVVGRFLAEFVHSSDRPALSQHLHEAGGADGARCELRLHVHPGSICDCELRSCCVAGSDTHYLMQLTDVSERVHYVEHLRKVNEELKAENEARRSSEAAKRELEIRLHHAEHMESLGMLAAGIAHDFNNLLVGVVSGADLLLRSPGLSDDHRQTLRLIERAGQNAADLTRQMLVFAGDNHVRKSVVDVRELVNECHSLVRTRGTKGTPCLEVIQPSELPPVEADRSQLHQGILNLVTNAVEATNHCGMVSVRTSMRTFSDALLAEFSHPGSAAAGDYVVVEVADTGSGIPPDHLKRIFDPFFTTKFTGRGLGLASVLGIVQAHGGALHVQSQHGRGTLFEIALPASAAAVAAGVSKPAAHSCGHYVGRVMLVDDDPAVRRVISAQLRALGLSVTAFGGGHEALKQLSQDAQAFDLFVLDWLMPEVTGDKVFEAARSAVPQAPVIMVTGYSKTSFGVADPRVLCLQKPFSLSELESAVQQCLEGPPLAHSA